MSEVVLICWKLEAQWDLIGLLLWALNPFKMILFWGLKKFPLRREIPALKDHLIDVHPLLPAHRVRDLAPRAGGARRAVQRAPGDAAGLQLLHPQLQ